VWKADGELLLEGSWRLVWTTSDNLRMMSGIPGGSVDATFEIFKDGVMHQAAVSHAPSYSLLAPLAIVVNLFLAVMLKTGFWGGVLLTLLTFSAIQMATVPGLYVTRRTELKVDDDLVVTSQLERMCIVWSANSCDFDVNARDPTQKFKAKFDASPASKDSLKHGFLFGWRLARKPWALHVMPATRTRRRERIIYADQQIRIMEGGDVLVDGSTNDAVSVFVRVAA